MVDLIENDTINATRPTRRRWPWILALVAGAIFLMGGGIAFVTLTQETELMDQSVSPDKISSLVVMGDAGDITITGQDRSDIRVSSVLVTNSWSDAEVDVQTSDGRLTVDSSCDGILGFGTCTVEYDIYVPVDLLDEVSVDIAAGDIDILGLAAELDVEASAGDIQILDFAGSAARVRVSAGDILIAAVEATESIDVRTSAGDIEIVVPDEVYNVTTDVTAGSASVSSRQDPASERIINASTKAGDISITAR